MIKHIQQLCTMQNQHGLPVSALSRKYFFSSIFDAFLIREGKLFHSLGLDRRVNISKNQVWGATKSRLSHCLVLRSYCLIVKCLNQWICTFRKEQTLTNDIQYSNTIMIYFLFRKGIVACWTEVRSGQCWSGHNFKLGRPCCISFDSAVHFEHIGAFPDP